jgi:rod shape-determining protein MreD
MLALDLIDRRTMWRGYWTELVVATLFLTIDEWLQWRVAKLAGADVAFSAMIPPLIISICVFPLAAWVVSRIDVRRLGR